MLLINFQNSKKKLTLRKFLPVYSSLLRRNELLEFLTYTNFVLHIVPGPGDAEMLNFRGHELHPQGKDI